MLLLKKVLNRIIKNIYQIKILHELVDISYQNRCREYKEHIPGIFNEDLNIINTIRQEGIFITSLDELQIPSTNELLDCCEQAIPELFSTSTTSKKQFYISNPSNNALDYAEIFKWGLNSRLLNLIENYFCLPAAYHGTYLRRDLANSVERKSRLWHTDKEDRQMLKIIIYLNDVNGFNGAFQYISLPNSNSLWKILNYNHEYLKEERVNNIIPKSSWISCKGKKGTVIFVDTAKIFHRGQIPLYSDRLAVFFDYTSSYPLRPYYCKPSFLITDLLEISTSLTDKQKACIFWNSSLKKKLIEFEATTVSD